MVVAAVERTLTVIEALAGQKAPLELSDLAARTGLPASAAHRTLSTLVARGWVVQDADSQRYGLSLRMPMLAFRTLDMRFVPSVLQSALDGLAHATREYCRLALVEAGSLTWVARAQGAAKGLRYDPDMGAEIVLHATANGKAWLSTLPEKVAVWCTTSVISSFKSSATLPLCTSSTSGTRSSIVPDEEKSKPSASSSVSVYDHVFTPSCVPD